jgi:hypothetical protein
MTRVIVLLSLIAGFVMLAWSSKRYLGARAEAVTAGARLELVADQTRELSQLRAQAPPELLRARPAPGLTARIAGVVAVAGLPQSALQNVTPELETLVTTARGGKYRRMTVRLTLEPVTLPELGRVLSEWRSAEPHWTVSSIDLAPAGGIASGSQKRLRAALMIETTFADDAKEQSDAGR